MEIAFDVVRIFGQGTTASRERSDQVKTPNGNVVNGTAESQGAVKPLAQLDVVQTTSWMHSYPCSSCCSSCRNRKLSRDGLSTEAGADEPYALKKLLPVGTVTFQLAARNGLQDVCDHLHAEDGWHSFLGASPMLHFANNSDNTSAHAIEFLLKHHFLSATYHAASDGCAVVLRIYLIPHDFSGVKGALRNRKDNVLAPGRRYLRALLPKVTQDSDIWEGGSCSERRMPLLSDVKDRRTLAEIYSELASPRVMPMSGWGNISPRLLDYNDDLDGLGMRSTLYKYQRRSIAAMMQKELDLRDVPDPLFIPLKTMDMRQFYVQPGTMTVLQECPMVAPCRGGILCEELGTGKTVMIIGLILATLRQISTPEESIIDDRPVLTPLSLRHFPSPESSAARRRLSRDQHEKLSPFHVPSLVELLIHRSRTTPNINVPDTSAPHELRKSLKTQTIEDDVEMLPLGQLLKDNVPFYHHYTGDPTNNERVRRAVNKLGPRVMYLTSATLIVVPPNLVGQWDREITKHAEYPLRILILRSKSPLPALKSLASDYDIILMTYNRFTAEASKKDISKLHSSDPCTCPEFPGSRVPNCTCQVFDVTPFLQIRWKRLVIDEGHVSAFLSTILTPFTKLLSVERRWIVTGTPTTNLLGLGLGRKTAEEASHFEDDDEEMEDLFGDGGIGSPTDIIPSPSPSDTSRSPSAEMPSSRVWNKHDREDLRKLGNMVAHFISVPQFGADSKLMNTHVTEPLLDPQGPRPGAISVLNQVMEMVMIRHRIEDVEDDVLLPPVTHESVLLDLDPLVVRSYNAMQATIAINAIDSQRTDQDYMFHPRNSDALQLTVKNMSQLMFWSVEEGKYNVDQLARDAQIHINRAIERNTPPEDMNLLYDAFKHVKLASEDQLWRSVHDHEDIPYRVYQMNEQVYHAWSRTPGCRLESDPNFRGFLHADRLLKLYNLILHRPLIPEELLVTEGMKVNIEDRVARKAYVESQKKKSNKSHHHRNARSHDDVSSQTVDSAMKKAAASETLKEMQKELDTSMALENIADDDECSSAPIITPAPAPGQSGLPLLSDLVRNSPLVNVRIGSSASNKLNYIINEVLKYSARDKFLIFSDSELSLAHISEALQLVQVKFLRFTTQIPAQFREQLVLTFETSPTYRVFLMELKHGARGLNLISASRVIFCEPVWQADVESQAIKRAHRIGQTRPITVKTLAIRGTAEENMVARRNALCGSHDKLPKLIEEAGMRHYIANPKFIEYPPVYTPNIKIDFPLFKLPQIPHKHPSEVIKLRIPALRPSPQHRVSVEGVVTPEASTSQRPPSPWIDAPPKKKLRVRFE